MHHDLGLDLLHDVRPADVDSFWFFCARHHAEYPTNRALLATEL
jgi:hypothetical protein